MPWGEMGSPPENDKTKSASGGGDQKSKEQAKWSAITEGFPKKETSELSWKT